MQNTSNLEQQAKAILPKDIYDFIAGGAETERTILNNRHYLEKIQITPRVLNDVSNIDLSTEILGVQYQSPIIFAPTAFHKLVCDAGEIAAAQIAKKTGSLMEQMKT